MTSAALAPDAPAIAARRPRRLAPTAYLTAAISIAVISVMGAPIVLSALASIKTAADASASPPHYLPSALVSRTTQRSFATRRAWRPMSATPLSSPSS